MTITGRLTRDAEVRTTSQDKQVVNFSVATNDSYRNKQGERIEQTTYFDCSYWITPNVAKLLTKGTLVELSGRVSTRAWTGNDGEPRAGLVCLGNSKIIYWEMELFISLFFMIDLFMSDVTANVFDVKLLNIRQF